MNEMNLHDNKQNDTNTKILEAATSLFEKKGYHSTSIRDICKEAEISKGGLFYHFNSKEDILVLIHDTFISYELEQAQKIINEDKDPATTMQLLIMDLVESIGRFRPYVSVFFQERKFLSQDKFTEVREKRDRYEEIFCRVIKEGIEKGDFRKDIDPVLMVKAIFGMCNWTYQWLNPEGKLAPREIGKLFYNMLFEGMEK